MPYTGVPKIIRKENIFTPEYPMTTRNINHATTRTFYYGMFKYTIIFGLVAAWYVTDYDYMRDELSSRPDLKEMRILVRDDFIPIKEKKVFEVMQGTYHGKKLYEEKPIGGLYKRILRKIYPYYEYNPNPNNIAPYYDYKKDYTPENMSNHYHF